MWHPQWLGLRQDDRQVTALRALLYWSAVALAAERPFGPAVLPLCSWTRTEQAEQDEVWSMRARLTLSWTNRVSTDTDWLHLAT